MKLSYLKDRGFTLIELLVVIAIIGILASVVLASLNSARDKGQAAAAASELKSLANAIALLYDDTGFYPNGADSYCRDVSGSGTEFALDTANAGLLSNGQGWAGWNGPYVRDVEDPWGNPYYFDEDYRCMTDTLGCKGIDDGMIENSSVLVSCGPNGDEAAGACAYDTDNVVYRLCKRGSD